MFMFSGRGIRKLSSQNIWNLPGKNPNTVFVTFNQVNEQLGIQEDNPWHKPVISSAIWKVKVIFLRDILESSLRVNFSSDCSSFKIKVKIFFYFTKMPLNSKTKYTVLFFNSFFLSPPLSLSPFFSLSFPYCPFLPVPRHPVQLMVRDLFTFFPRVSEVFTIHIQFPICFIIYQSNLIPGPCAALSQCNCFAYDNVS